MKQRICAVGLLAVLTAGLLSSCGSPDVSMNSYSDFSDLSQSVYQGNTRLEGIAAAGSKGDDSAAADDERITAEAAVTVILDSGIVSFSHQAKEELSENPFDYLTTILAAAEASEEPFDKQEVLVTGEMLAGTEGQSCSGLQTGDTISVQELMFGTVVGGYYDTTKILAQTAEENREETKAVSAYDLALAYQEAINQDFFLQISGEAWHELSWQKADGNRASFGITSQSSSRASSLENTGECTIISGLLTQTEESGYSWILYYRTADGDYRISVLIGVPDTDSLISQMDIILTY